MLRAPAAHTRYCRALYHRALESGPAALVPASCGYRGSFRCCRGFRAEWPRPTMGPPAQLAPRIACARDPLRPAASGMDDRLTDDQASPGMKWLRWIAAVIIAALAAAGAVLYMRHARKVAARQAAARALSKADELAKLVPPTDERLKRLHALLHSAAGTDGGEPDKAFMQVCPLLQSAITFLVVARRNGPAVRPAATSPLAPCVAPSSRRPRPLRRLRPAWLRPGTTEPAARGPRVSKQLQGRRPNPVDGAGRARRTLPRSSPS